MSSTLLRHRYSPRQSSAAAFLLVTPRWIPHLLDRSPADSSREPADQEDLSLRRWLPRLSSPLLLPSHGTASRSWSATAACLSSGLHRGQKGTPPGFSSCAHARPTLAMLQAMDLGRCAKRFVAAMVVCYAGSTNHSLLEEISTASKLIAQKEEKIEELVQVYEAKLASMADQIRRLEAKVDSENIERPPGAVQPRGLYPSLEKDKLIEGIETLLKIPKQLIAKQKPQDGAEAGSRSSKGELKTLYVQVVEWKISAFDLWDVFPSGSVS